MSWKWSGYDLILNENINKFSDAGVVDYENLVMSKGNMLVPSVVIIPTTANDGTVSFDTTLVADPLETVDSYVFAIAFNATKNEVIGVTNDIVSIGYQYTQNIHGKIFDIGDTIKLYVAVKN